MLTFNLRIALRKNSNLNSANLFSLMIRKLNIFQSFRIIKDVKSKLQHLLKKKKLPWSFSSQIISIPRTFKCHSFFIVSLWTRQCECILGQRFKNSKQMFFKFGREEKLKNVVSRSKLGNIKRGKEIFFGAVSLLSFQWDKNRISEADMKSHVDDFKYVYKLRDETLCKGCKSKKATEATENICHCDNYHPSETPLKYDQWETFIEKKDLVVWRRQHGETGNFEYKVYGSYNDVTAEEFLNVQVDTAYRRIWDTTAIVLDIVEKDPTPGSNSDIIYWEMLWPMLFANRDYVFTRRYLVDYKTKTILISNKSVVHPSCPEKSDKFRIKDYYSNMTIKPYTELNKQGIEFVLTYYDNPGVSIPTKVQNWVAMRAMPDFLERLRDAAKKYKAYCKQSGVKCICLLEETSLTFEEESDDYLYYFLDSEDDLVTDNTISEAQHNITKKYKKTPDPPKPQVPSKSTGVSKSKQGEPSDSNSPIVQRGTKNFWKYFYPSYYIS